MTDAKTTETKTSGSAGFSLSDFGELGALLSGGNIYALVLDKLKEILSDVLGDNGKTKLMKELADGKLITEVHTKQGRKNEKPKKFIPLKCITGIMTLKETGPWTCTAIWSDKGVLYQGTFSMHVDSDSAKTTLSFQISSPPGTPATSYKIVDFYFKIDRDLRFDTQYTASGELGITYQGSDNNIHMIVFTTDKDQIVGV